MGAGPRQLHFGLNKAEYNLTNEDIEGTKPNCVKFKSLRQPSNPLNPQYKLQSFQFVPPPPPKFVRDTMLHDDVDGSHPKPTSSYATRNYITTADIDGASPKKPHQRKQLYDYIGYNEIYAKGWQSRRCTNPLMPQYIVRDKIKDGDFLRLKDTEINNKYGDIQGSVPNVLPQPVSGVRNLNTEDIKGAQADTKLLGAFTHYERRPDQVRATTTNDDIAGSAVNTLKRGVVTTRETNPLQPNYQMPGTLEPEENNI